MRLRMSARRFAVIALALGACAAQSSSDARADGTKPHPIRASKPSDDVLRAELTSIQYSVTQNNDTEMPFHNPYWDNHQAGIYVDVTTNQPLFSSLEKFDSGTGWPSFWKPIAPEALGEKLDATHGMDRKEGRSKIGDP